MPRPIRKAREAFLTALWESLETDILFECFVALLPQEARGAGVHVIPTRNHLRNLSHDIVAKPAESEYDQPILFEAHPAGKLIMYTSRSAILDYLPEDFFIEPDEYIEDREAYATERKNENKEARRRRLEEQQKSAQRFFHPIEIAGNQLRLQREQEEVHLITHTDELLEKLWPEYPQKGDAWDRFRRTLQLVPYIIGQLDKTCDLIKYVLQLPIKLELLIEDSYQMTEAEEQALNGDTAIIGYNMVLGNRVYDFQEVCLLKIEDISTEQFFEFQDQTSSIRILLQAIIDNYFPLHAEVRPEYAIAPAKPGQVAEPMVLGYSTVLGCVSDDAQLDNL